MNIIDIPALPQHEDLARVARVLFKTKPDGEALYPNVKTSYVFWEPNEEVAPRFVRIPDHDVATVIEKRGDAELAKDDIEFDPAGKICTIGVVIW